MPLSIGSSQFSEQIINCTMAYYVISTNDSYLFVNFVESFAYDSFDHRVLFSRLKLLGRPIIIPCGRYSNHMINDVMADFAVYTKFGLKTKFKYLNFNNHFAQWKDASLLLNHFFKKNSLFKILYQSKFRI